MSITLSGVDKGRWTTIALTDSTSVATAVHPGVNADDAPCPHGLRRDPVAGLDIFPGNMSHEDAKEYFLWVWSVRIESVVREWDIVIAALRHAVQEYDLA